LDYELISEESKGGFKVESVWFFIINRLFGASKKTHKDHEYIKYLIPITDFPEGSIPERWQDCNGLVILEHKNPEENQIRGLVLANYDDEEDKFKEFHEWFSKVVIRDSRVHLSYSTSLGHVDVGLKLASAVADFFSEHLLNSTIHDEWAAKGREHFIGKLGYFTKRNIRIEAVLPAFPCKSSNLQKVAGVVPDRGEEMALRRLIEFSKSIQSLYEPGMKLWIVSDGHVFSDCIGVDDDVVDQYTAQLKDLYQKVAQNEGCADEDLIGFVSLKDIFFHKGLDFRPALVDEVELPHYTGSKICDDSELSRRMLMASCDTDAGKLKRDIQQRDHPRLHLYRGFTKFMCEDLALNTLCQTLSSKAFKKTVSKVAFEMIKRNDAYSNLVELMFPHHMRLSIHAHDNGGPKFGIKIIKPETCRVIKSFNSGETPDFEDLLHIPTPWHNCMVEVEGSDVHYMTKSQIVLDAIDEGHYEGEWRKGNREPGQAGYFHLAKKGN
jgi:pyoverdine/dityrosine biosynthesis protein Dit1